MKKMIKFGDTDGKAKCHGENRSNLVMYNKAKYYDENRSNLVMYSKTK